MTRIDSETKDNKLDAEKKQAERAMRKRQVSDKRRRAIEKDKGRDFDSDATRMGDVPEDASWMCVFLRGGDHGGGQRQAVQG